MPQPTEHTADGQVLQEQTMAEQCWQELVAHRLPSDIETQAYHLGAFRRKRAVESAQGLLRALLCYVLSLSSLKQLSVWSRLLGISHCVISAPAWNKRLQKSARWLLWLCNALLDLRLSTQLAYQQRLLLVDATHLSEIGPKGETWRLHCAYDLLEGQLAWMQVSSQQMGESLSHLPIRQGDILVADKAYSKAPQLLSVAQAQAYSLTRFSPWHLPVYTAGATKESPKERIAMQPWLQSLSPGTYERFGTVFAERKRLLVRVIAVVFAPEQAEALRQARIKQAREKGSKLSEQSLFFAGFHLLITTLPQTQWPLNLVLELYACRWQIEILFKRIKQVLDTHRLPCRVPETAQAMIAALLVAWLLIEEEANLLREQITQAEPLSLPVSSWQLDQWGKAALQQVVQGWWSPQQLRDLSPELRGLYREQRRRPLHEHQRRCRFHRLLRAQADFTTLFDCSRA